MPTHVVKSGASKWYFGRALCGCTMSRYTPVSLDRNEVDCRRCLSRLSTLKAERLAQYRAGLAACERELRDSGASVELIAAHVQQWREQIALIEAW